MTNFYLRLFTSFIIAPIFIFALYEANILFYIILILIFLLSCYEIFIQIKQKKLVLFILILLFFFIFSLLKVRGNEFTNYIYLLWVLLIVWLSDIFGYIVGKFIGGSKLTIYSPNKTISGVFGSIIFSQFSIFLPLFYLESFNISLKIILIQLFLCLVSILGDIFFSYVKRINGIKDYSSFIPGHGGILDRIDGMIFVVIFYHLILILNVL